MKDRSDLTDSSKHPQSTAFLLAQIGAHAAMQFSERLGQIGLVPVQAGILRTVAANSGLSQQTLAKRLGIVPSRLVTLLDELEEKGLLERLDHAEDRRLYALALTDKGMKVMADIGRIARAHDDGLCAALAPAERRQLWSLLVRIAEEQRLEAGVHPGFSRLGGSGSKEVASEKGKAAARGRVPRP